MCVRERERRDEYGEEVRAVYIVERRKGRHCMD